jgi:hypothetical protein
MEREGKVIKGKFELGRFVGTPGALEALARNQKAPIEYIMRHWTGDWGDLDDEDKEENEFSLERGFRILSS